MMSREGEDSETDEKLCQSVWGRGGSIATQSPPARQASSRSWMRRRAGNTKRLMSSQESDLAAFSGLPYKSRTSVVSPATRGFSPPLAPRFSSPTLNQHNDICVRSSIVRFVLLAEERGEPFPPGCELSFAESVVSGSSTRQWLTMKLRAVTGVSFEAPR